MPHGPGFARHPAARVTIVAAALAFVTSACGGGGTTRGVASVGSPSTTAAAASGGGSSSSQPHADETGIAYSQCMRKHGLPNFPDYNSQGDLQIGPAAVPGGLNSPTYQAAQKACQSLMPGPSTPRRRRPLPTRRRSRSHGACAPTASSTSPTRTAKARS